jgi:hypothetical protein
MTIPVGTSLLSPGEIVISSATAAKISMPDEPSVI